MTHVPMRLDNVLKNTNIILGSTMNRIGEDLWPFTKGIKSSLGLLITFAWQLQFQNLKWQSLWFAIPNLDEMILGQIQWPYMLEELEVSTLALSYLMQSCRPLGSSWRIFYFFIFGVNHVLSDSYWLSSTMLRALWNTIIIYWLVGWNLKGLTHWLNYIIDGI